jgi:hypothetical protein
MRPDNRKLQKQTHSAAEALRIATRAKITKRSQIIRENAALSKIEP